MKKEYRKSADVKAELGAAIKREKELRKTIAKLDEQLKDCKEELAKLNGSMWSPGSGTIGSLERELDGSTRFEQDQTAQTVYFTRDGKPYECSDRYVVSRVTPKRIFVREEGYARESQYFRDGTHNCESKCIDLARTFPDGIENWKPINVCEL